MPVYKDFNLVRYEDGTLIVSMTPPIPIGGWDISFSVNKHFGMGIGSGLINKYVGSGYNNQSGINITNSGNGVFSVSIRSMDTSGVDAGSYVYSIDRVTSGNRSSLTQGYFTVNDR